MGGTFMFVCEKCRYESEASGRLDWGFKAVIQTILCTDCKELYDVLVPGLKPEDIGPELDLGQVYCPKARGHSVRLWEYPDVCPKCGGEMINGGLVTLWV